MNKKALIINAIKKLNFKIPSDLPITLNDFINAVIDESNGRLEDKLKISSTRCTTLLRKNFPDKKPYQHISTYILLKIKKRECSTCREIKNLDNFYTNSARADGYQANCIDCTKVNGRTKYSGYYKNKSANKRAKIKLQKIAYFYKDEVTLLYKYCSKDYHLDHRIPICHENVSGLHVPWNLQYLFADTNIRKSNEFNQEYWSDFSYKELKIKGL